MFYTLPYPGVYPEFSLESLQYVTQPSDACFIRILYFAFFSKSRALKPLSIYNFFCLVIPLLVDKLKISLTI